MRHLQTGLLTVNMYATKSGHFMAYMTPTWLVCNHRGLSVIAKNTTSYTKNNTQSFGCDGYADINYHCQTTFSGHILIQETYF